LASKGRGKYRVDGRKRFIAITPVVPVDPGAAVSGETLTTGKRHGAVPIRLEGGRFGAHWLVNFVTVAALETRCMLVVLDKQLAPSAFGSGTRRPAQERA
jgi:hypothetical protein